MTAYMDFDPRASSPLRQFGLLSAHSYSFEPSEFRTDMDLLNRAHNSPSQAKEYGDLLTDFKSIGQGGKIYFARSAPVEEADPLEHIMGENLETIPGLFKTSITNTDSEQEVEQVPESEVQDDDGDRDGVSEVGSTEWTKAPSAVIVDQTLPLVPASIASADDFVPVLSRKTKKPTLGFNSKMSMTSSAVSTKNTNTASMSEAKKRKKSRGNASGFQPTFGSEYDYEDYLSVKRYMPRPCHRFYLTNGCKNGAKCHYGHEYDVSI